MGKLITGIGDVDSADIAGRIFTLSRQVNASDELQAAFAEGFEGVFDRIATSASAEAAEFTAAVDEFMYVHGSRGPNEYDPYSWSYESRPLLLAQAIDKVRGARRRPRPHGERWLPARPNGNGSSSTTARSSPPTPRPRARSSRRSTRSPCSWQRASGARATTSGSSARFASASSSSGAARSMRGTSATSARCSCSLADELDDWLADPAAFTERLAEREQDYLSLYELEPPYIVDMVVPPLSEWRRKDSLTAEPVAVGDVLSGVAGSPGTVTGTARVLHDLDDGERLEPGDILIAESTDPSWTPLFLAAGGVITNIGAIGTHAVIVSRELGIPCVPSIADATRRIPDGATITLDGSSGKVTIDAVP